MHGRFSLSRLETPNNTYIIFGQLVDFWDIEQSAIAVPESNIELAGNMVAHDVIEHSVAHRSARSTSIEEELRAFGAIEFVRGDDVDIMYDVANMAQLYSKRGLKMPPMNRRYLGYATDDIKDACLLEGVELSDQQAFIILANLNYGWANKAKQFNDDAMAAYNAFHFISAYSQDVIKQLFSGIWENKACVYFDTVKNIFRVTYQYSTQLEELYAKHPAYPRFPRYA